MALEGIVARKARRGLVDRVLPNGIVNFEIGSYLRQDIKYDSVRMKFGRLRQRTHKIESINHK